MNIHRVFAADSPHLFVLCSQSSDVFVTISAKRMRPARLFCPAAAPTSPNVLRIDAPLRTMFFNPGKLSTLSNNLAKIN